MLFLLLASMAALPSSTPPVAIATCHPQEDSIDELFADDEPDGCRKCDHRGVNDCKLHGKMTELEHAAVFCSQAAACKKCFGALLIPCEKCEGGPESRVMYERQGRFEHRLNQPDPCRDQFKREIVRVEGEHFVVQIDAHKLRNGKSKTDAHLFAHLMLQEAEKAALLFEGHFPDVWYTGEKPRIWFWGKVDDHLTAMHHVLGASGSGDFKLMGPAPVSTASTPSDHLQNKAKLVAMLGVHSAIHLLLDNACGEVWLGQQKAGWFDAGAAHWYEMQLFNQTLNYCIDEVKLRANFKNGQWFVHVKNHLATHSEPILPAMLRKMTGHLDVEDHPFSWSLFDWLVRAHPDKTTDLLLSLKAKRSSRAAFQEVFKWNVARVEQEWRAWVAAEYPSKNPKPRKKL